ncbi:MAG: cytochrome c biogenesis protein ResB, partial [Acidobacteriota bacterium]
MKPVWKFFSSVKLAIALLILIAVASLIGTLIPQGLPPAAYAARYGRLAGVLSAFQLTGLYHSGWYLTLLFFLAANTIVCTLARLPAKWRRAFHPKIETEPSELAAMKNAHRFGKNGPPAEAASRLESVLRSHRYRVLAKPSEKRVSILARKRTSGLFGSDFVHLGLLVIIAGGIVSGLAGFRVQLDLAEGQTAKVPRAPFEIRLDRFETEYYPQGSVKAWKSTLTVIENGAEVRSSLILVNKPLDYKGFSFYQAAYGSTWNNATVEITIKKKSDPAFARAVRPRVGEEAAVDDKDVTRLFIKRFVPDFVIGEGNEVQSRSDEPKNPAALVEGWQGGEKIFSGWLFANFPDFA